MPPKSHQIEVPMSLILILLLASHLTVPVKALDSSRKLDETTVPATNGGEKCSPCGDIVNSPPPPPPALPPPPPPPPSPKKSPSQYCPPPPAFIYITGPPGNLYPLDENFNGASRPSFAAVAAALPGLLTLLLGFW